ncbi:hypothetical protein GPB2148_2361 [marine gamma proteobacterium HTCC2148]|jgi:hypothetical protein|nr:hypothetical protein GPB2148_2361 [marine gamma proteobacterium HTCC2148]
MSGEQSVSRREENPQISISAGSGRKYKTPRLERFGEISHVTQGSFGKKKDAEGDEVAIIPK